MRWTLADARRTALACGLGLLAGLGGCLRDAAPPADGPSGRHELPPVDGAIPEASIFDLDLALVDQDGVTIALRDLAGQPMLAAMVYTSCTDVCILVTEQMKVIERQLGSVDHGVRYVLFSLDPGRDSPAAMREFARVQKLDTARWRLMASDEEGVRDLAAVLGVRHRPEDSGEIAHSAMIFVIDAAGIVRYRQVGVASDARELVAAVKRARG
jgi:protein SCO1/2